MIQEPRHLWHSHVLLHQAPQQLSSKEPQQAYMSFQQPWLLLAIFHHVLVLLKRIFSEPPFECLRFHAEVHICKHLPQNGSTQKFSLFYLYIVNSLFSLSVLFFSPLTASQLLCKYSFTSILFFNKVSAGVSHSPLLCFPQKKSSHLQYNAPKSPISGARVTAC